MKWKTLAALTGASAVVLSAAKIYKICEQGLLGIHPLKAPKKGEIRVACVGDSITYGHGVKNWSRNNYPVVLNDLLGEGYLVNNYGFSGRTASPEGDFPYTAEKLYQKSLDFLPDVVFLMLGTNDTKPYNWKGREAYAEDCRALIRTYKALASHPKLFLMTPPPAWSVNGEPVAYDIYADLIEGEVRPALIHLAEEEEVELIDLFSVFASHADLFPDGVHPNAEGAALIAKTLKPYVLE